MITAALEIRDSEDHSGCEGDRGWRLGEAGSRQSRYLARQGLGPSCVKAMHTMLMIVDAKDYLTASGESHSLREFVGLTFGIVDLGLEIWLKISGGLLRPADLRHSAINPLRTVTELGWTSVLARVDLVANMYAEKLF
jgi:GDP-D-mannose dehydratase